MATSTATPVHHAWWQHLYVQVLVAIVLGAVLGNFYPGAGAAMKPLGDIFIKLIRMLIAPIIFCTVIHGIASMTDMKRVGRVGIKALVYFEAMTTLALIVGLVIVDLWRPGSGMNVVASSIDTKSIQGFTKAAGEHSSIDFLLNIVPNTVVGAFSDGEVVQVLLIAILLAFALHALGERGRPVIEIIDRVGQAFFKIVGYVMKLAPIGAFGAMAFTIGRYGIGTLLSLGQLMACFYATCLVFIFGVMGIVAKLAGFNIFKLVRYIREELLIVLGTSSSEAALPRLIAKMENLGCDSAVVGLVIPTGYSFNLDGTCIYLTMAAMFLAQATNTDLSLGQEIGLLAILLLTSKGAAGVTGSGFIVLAATLSSVGTVPVASIALILGVDRFMSEARALTNLIGNSVATIVVAKWDGALDAKRLLSQLDGETDDPERVLVG